MTPPCRNIKYREGRSSKPVVRIKRPRPPPKSPSSGSDGFDNNGENEFGKLIIDPVISPGACLRRWVQKQRFIPQDLSDDFLQFFLSASGYCVDLAADRLMKYFTARQEPSPLFRDRDPLSPGNVKIFTKLYVLPLPGTTEDGRKIILTGLIKPTSSYDQLEHTKALALVIDLLIWEKDFGFGDFVIVLDGQGFECPALLENKFYNQRSIKNLLLDTIPGTLRSFYLLYPPPHVANVADNRNGIWMNIVKTKQQMISLLPADILPLEYGGNLGHLGDLLEQWDFHMVQNRDFFLEFERKMINDYRRKLCHEQELKEGGSNWVQKMKLETDEWEYKTQYYENMKTKNLRKHLTRGPCTQENVPPSFGPLRRLNKPKSKSHVNPLNEWRNLARAEEESAKTFQAIPLNNGYAKEIQKAKLEAERENATRCCAHSPVLELKIFYF